MSCELCIMNWELFSGSWLRLFFGIWELLSIATPNSVNAYGIYFKCVPCSIFKVTNCDLKHSSFVNWNKKSSGKRSILRFTAWLSFSSQLHKGQPNPCLSSHSFLGHCIFSSELLPNQQRLVIARFSFWYICVPQKYEFSDNVQAMRNSQLWIMGYKLWIIFGRQSYGDAVGNFCPSPSGSLSCCFFIYTITAHKKRSGITPAPLKNQFITS